MLAPLYHAYHFSVSWLHFFIWEAFWIFFFRSVFHFTDLYMCLNCNFFFKLLLSFNFYFSWNSSVDSGISLSTLPIVRWFNTKLLPDSFLVPFGYLQLFVLICRLFFCTHVCMSPFGHQALLALISGMVRKSHDARFWFKIMTHGVSSSHVFLRFTLK